MHQIEGKKQQRKSVKPKIFWVKINNTDRPLERPKKKQKRESTNYQFQERNTGYHNIPCIRQNGNKGIQRKLCTHKFDNLIEITTTHPI